MKVAYPRSQSLATLRTFTQSKIASMRVTIEYNSSWRNSFLGSDNNSPLPKGGRKFIASISGLKDKANDNYIAREITHDTVMGLLNRLIGDQRKLYQARENNETYYFRDIENNGNVSFKDDPSKQIISHEIVYLRNISGNTDPNSFAGMIKAEHPMFSSEYSQRFWGVLGMDLETLCKFICDEHHEMNDKVALDPIAICNQFDIFKKQKPVLSKGVVAKSVARLGVIFPDDKYLKDEKVRVASLYCAALYIQLERLESMHNMDMGTAKTSRGKIKGISKRNFTKKDFMKGFATGGYKPVWGNPYIKKTYQEGLGETTSMLTKASGTLIIKIDVDEARAKEIEEMIECAGVSTFHLGKKGLAYVSDIRL